MTTKITTENIEQTSLATLEGPKVTNIQITTSGGTVLDDTAIALGGGYIKITGTGFQSGCQIRVASALATSVTFVSSTEVRAQVGAASAGSYDVVFINPDGGTALRINGLTYSDTPTWVTGSTLPEQAVDVAISIQLQATGATTYSLQAGSSLPAGVTLSSGGLISGTVTGIVEQTTYNFTVEAIDNELQDSPRSFSVTVTVGPPPGTLYTWGLNNKGQLGLNNTIDRSSPVQIGSDATWTTLAVSDNFSFGIKLNSTLWSFGYNFYGQLGLNDIINRSSPVQLGSSTDWELVSALNYATLIKKSNGTLWSMGRNNQGQLGLGDGAQRSSPTQIGSSNNWNQISMGILFAGATKTDGTLWMWGLNSYGRLGLNDTNNRNSPVQVGNATDWSDVSCADNFTLAKKTNGTLWAWGRNNSGQLGLNDRVLRSSPVQIGSSTDWDKITNGFEEYNLVTKVDGSLWSWGNNNWGQLGLSTTYRSSPTQVGTGTDWDIISAGRRISGAIKNNGTLWLWGQNTYGSLGFNNTSNTQSPAQLGSGTTWVNIVTGRNVLAIKQ